MASVNLLSTETNQTDGPKNVHTETYEVAVTSFTDGSAVALTADDGSLAVPAYNAAITIDGITCRVRRKRVHGRGERAPKRFLVTVEYQGDSTLTTTANPLVEPTVYSYEDNEEHAPYFRDAEDTPVVNSAGQPFNDLPTRSVSRGAIVVTKNVANYNDQTAESFRNTINSAGVTINGVAYAARKLRITGFSATGPHTRNGVDYWSQTIRIAKKPEGWDQKIDDKGVEELHSTGKTKPILDATHAPIFRPHPLDGSGGAKTNATDQPAVLTFKPYKAGAFPDLT